MKAFIKFCCCFFLLLLECFRNKQLKTIKKIIIFPIGNEDVKRMNGLNLMQRDAVGLSHSFTKKALKFLFFF